MAPSLPDDRAGARRGTRRKAPKPLDSAALATLALAYVGRFATSRARLARYLDRKIRECGWAGAEPADVTAIVEKLHGHGYVDDAAFAESKARSLVRRGFGERRIATALYAAGIGEEDGTAARLHGEEQRVAAALRLAERRRWGPYAAERMVDPVLVRRAMATFLRAGHDSRLARRILALAPGEDMGGLE